MKNNLLLVSILACIFLGISHPAFALRISPFKATIDPDAKIKNQVFRVENNSDEPIAVQVSVLTWDMQSDGTEINNDASKEFAVFPAQVILKPHEGRSVRVQWLGSGIPDIERPYRVLVEQIATNLNNMPERQTGVKFMLRFMAALYVTPQNPKSDVEISNYKILPGNILHVDLTNKGGEHTLLKNTSLKIVSGTNIIVLVGDQLKPIEGENIHAGKTRSFDITLPPNAPANITAARISFDNGF